MSAPAPARLDVTRPPSNIEGLRFQLAVFAIGFLIICSRRPDAILNAQFFAEDGAFFYRDAYQFGLHSLLLSYGGYFHALFRLVALFAQLVPLAWAPLFMNLAGITLQVLPVTVLLSSRFSHISFRLRLLAAFVYLAIPNSYEIDANATNLQWHQALLSCMLLLAQTPKTRSWRIFDATMLLLMSVSSPIGILLVPVAALMWWNQRQAWSAASFAFLLPGSVIQIVSVLMHWHARQVPHLDLSGHPIYNGGPTGANVSYLVAILGRQVFLSSLLGLNTQYWVFHLKSVATIELACTITGLFFLIYALRYAPVQLKLFILSAYSVLALGLVNPLAGQPNVPQWSLLCIPGCGNRYYFLPMLAFLASLFWVATRESSAKAIRGFAVILLLLLPIGISQDWSYPPFQDFHFKHYASAFEGVPSGTKFSIPINPDWLMQLTKH